MQHMHSKYVDALKKEYGMIVWGYQKTTPEEFIDYLFGADHYWRTWATGKLLLHGSWKLIIELLGIDEVIARWPDVQKLCARNRFTERMYRDIDWVSQYMAGRVKYPLKIQLMPSHYFYGENETSLLHGFPIDSVRNIFSEKIAAFMDRRDPKDISDIYAILTMHGGFKMSEIIAEAVPKGINVTVPNLCRAVLEFDYDRLQKVQWTSPVNISVVRAFMTGMADVLLCKGEFETPFVFSPGNRSGLSR